MWIRFLDYARNDAGRSRMAKADEILTTTLRFAQDDIIGRNDIMARDDGQG